MQIKQQWKIITCLGEWLKSGTLTTPNASEDTKQKECSFTAGGNGKTVQPLWKTFWRFLIKSHTLLLIYSNELNIYIHTKTYTQMFIVVWFIISQTWKQLRCFSVGEWINKLWYIHIKGYYSVVKQNELLTYVYTTIWVNFQRIMLTEKASLPRLHTVWFHLYNIL